MPKFSDAEFYELFNDAETTIKEEADAQTLARDDEDIKPLLSPSVTSSDFELDEAATTTAAIKEKIPAQPLADDGEDVKPLHSLSFTSSDLEIDEVVTDTDAAITTAETKEAPTLALANDDEDTKPLPSPLPASTSQPSKQQTSPLHEPALLLPHGLPAIKTKVNNQYAYLFFRFCWERQNMWQRRREGIPRGELSTDETMTKTRVGNIYRELDPSGDWFRRHVICVGEQSQQEICFRIFFFSAFYMCETWQALIDGLGYVPSWKQFNLEAYEAILYQRSIVSKEKIYYSGFQLVPPVVYFGRRLPHYAANLRMVEAMMEMGLPEKLANTKYAVDASELIRTVPTFGGFLSLCLLCNLNEVPGWKFYYRDFATCGPGSRSYLKRLFGEKVINSEPMEQAGLKWLFQNQWTYWARLGKDPPHAWSLGIRPGLRILDIENGLCWTHRYVNDFTKRQFGSLNDLPFPTYASDKAHSPAWCDEQKYSDTSSKAVFEGDYEEEAAKLDEVEDDMYEIEKIVCRSRTRVSKDTLFRVRWKGYPPEDDIWERASSLQDGAQNAVDEWKLWEETVVKTIARIREEEPYTGSMEGVRYTPGPIDGRKNKAGHKHRIDDDGDVMCMTKEEFDCSMGLENAHTSFKSKRRKWERIRSEVHQSAAAEFDVNI